MEYSRSGLIHRDFHPGNILNSSKDMCIITDLGLCRPANEESQEDKIYGVMPYVAPEILCGQPYTQASDIYSFGIIAYEILTGLPPYYNIPHDTCLALKICQGLRPELDKVKAPQLIKDLISQCWDADPTKRPTANKLWNIVDAFKYDIYSKESEFYQQYQKVKREFGKNKTPSFSYKTHPQAIYTSRLLDFKNLPEPQNSEEVNKQFYNSLTSSGSLDSLNFNWKNVANAEGYLNSNDLTLAIEPSGEYHSQDLDFDIEVNTNSATQETSQGLANGVKRQLSLESQTKTNQGETKQFKIVENSEYQTEPMSIDSQQNQGWTSIHLSFTPQLTQSWQNLNFTYEQARDWINIGLTPQDAKFAYFLKSVKQLTPIKVLNNHNLENLEKEFQTYQQSQQTTQTLQPANQSYGIPGSSK
jgi:serine/threonine protein kinase